MSVIPLLEFVAMLPAIERDMKTSERKIIERGAQIIQKRAFLHSRLPSNSKCPFWTPTPLRYESNAIYTTAMLFELR
jgi:hypothetical protein